MKNIFIAIVLIMALCSCTFLIIDKADIGLVSQADIKQATIGTVLDFKGNTQNTKGEK